MSEINENENSQKEQARLFGPSTFSVQNKTSIFLLTIMILLGGLFSYMSMPRENFPEIIIPRIFVQTTYPGNSPSDMENLITRPIEKEIKSLEGVKKISSTSIQDFSMIDIEFNTDVDPSEALLDVKDAVDKAKSELPTDLDRDPDVFELNFSNMPILNINLSGDVDRDRLKDIAEVLQDQIEDLREVSEVEIKGALEREVRIDVNVQQMALLELSFGDIENAIRSENVTISGGDLKVGDFRKSIRIAGEFTDAKQIGNVIVKNRDQGAVFLKDIAKIEFDYEDPDSYARTEGSDVVSLDVKKRSGENLVEAVDKIKKILDEAEENLFPPELTYTMTNDQSKMTRQQVANLENSIISGVILVVLVLLFFLGLRNALFVGIAIPLSMLMGFMILSFMDVTLNTMVLFSLILALGMLVDNGIVVVENIYRLLQEGKSHYQAAIEGVGEVALPIIASTLTTLAAFFPLLFWDDIWGEFMKYIPITLIIVLASSLFVALIINPVLTSVLMKVQEEKSSISWKRLIIQLSAMVFLAIAGHALQVPSFGNFFILMIGITLLNVFILRPSSLWFQHNLLMRIENGYYRLIKFALSGSMPWAFLTGTFALLVLSGVFFNIRSPKVEFLPINEARYVNIFIEAPQGTDIDEANRITADVEELIAPITERYEKMVESVIVNVGRGTTDPQAGPALGVTPHRAKITVSFVDFELRGGISSNDVMEEYRRVLQGFPAATITVDKDQNGPPAGKPVNLEVSGEDYETLMELAEDIKIYLDGFDVPGIEELKLDLEVGKPELLIAVDREKSRRYGVSTATVGSTIRTSVFGKEVSKFKQGEDDYPIMLRSDSAQRYDLEAIMNQNITFKDQNSGSQVSVPISAVASDSDTSAFGSINRKDLDRVITVYSNVKQGFNANEINAKLKKYMEDYEMPSGYSYKFTGEQEQQNDVMAFLATAFIVAIFLIALILVAQFNSVVKPFIILLAVFFSLIGVGIGFATFKMDVIILMTGIGVISLAGIVVNNAIVLIDYINLIRTRRRKELGLNDERLPFREIVESIIEGGKTRLRPVLLTAITTVLGLIPLAIGFNFNFGTFLHHWDPEIFVGGDNVVFWGPMAWTVIYGLTFATFLTLVIVPVMYLIFDIIAYWVGNLLSARKERKTSKSA